MNSSPQGKECRSREIASQLRTEIMSGKIPPGAPLVSIRTLAGMYGVGPRVIVSALAILSGHRLIQSQPRRGFRVADPLPRGKFLIITDDRVEDFRHLSFYFLPEFELLCRGQGILVEKMPVSLLRSAAPEQFRKMVADEKYTGILLFCGSYIGGEPEIKLLRETGLPVLQPDADVQDREITRFAVLERDDDGRWASLLRFLKERGYGKIGAVGNFSGSDQSGEGTAMLRCRPIQKHFSIMRELELEIPEDPLLFINLAHPDLNRRKFARWLKDYGRFDAIICYSDFYAMQLYDFCREEGIRIPEDLAVAAFGNYPGTNILSPPLTTMDFLPGQVAKHAFELLTGSASLLGAEGEAPRFVNPYRIVCRESTPCKMKRSTKGKSNA